MSSYKTQSGDSPARIARRFGVPIGALIGANPHKPTTVVGGQRTWQSIGIGEQLNLPVGVGLAPASIAGPHATIRRGSTGTDVATWQAFLGLPTDGVFGPNTDTATKSFQSSRGLTADGVVGPNTWAAAQSQLTTQTQAAQALYASKSIAPASLNSPHAQIKKGSSGPDVALWQTIIGVTADGVFGPNTDTATRAWQSKHGVAADGIVGPQTWAAAGAGGGVTQAAPVTSAPSSSVASTAAIAAAALAADPNYCTSVAKSGTPVNSAIHNFKASWNAANPGHTVPINTGKYEPVVASALSAALGGAAVPPGCGGAAAPAMTPVAPSVPTVTPVSTASVPTAVQAMASVDPCYSGNAAMVCAAQSALGLTADGKYGANTAAALRRLIPNAPGPCSPTPSWWGAAGSNKCGGGVVPSGGGAVPSGGGTTPSGGGVPSGGGGSVTPSGGGTPGGGGSVTPSSGGGTTPSGGGVTPSSGDITVTTGGNVTPSGGGGPVQPNVTPPTEKKISTGAMVAGGLGVAALVGIVAVVATSKGHGGGGGHKGHQGGRHSGGHKAHKSKPHKHSKKRR